MTKQEELAEFEEIRGQEIKLVGKAKTYVEELSEDEDFSDYGKDAQFRIAYSLNVLKNNVLPISLFAAMQSGKSTTTSAVADGHEITPCGRAGGGIRTSAVPVTIHNDDFATRVKINLYPKDVITHRIYEGVLSSLEGKSVEHYDIDKPEHIRILTEAARTEAEKYRADPVHYNTDNKLELLETAILSLVFYGSESYRWIVEREKNGEGFTIEEIQPFLAFETDINTRWLTLKEYGFDAVYTKDDKGCPIFGELESMHVFIDNIVIPVHSEFMELTGTAIIDAPGTLVNSFDTKRAIDAARSAAVVIFILNDYREFTNEDKDMLRTLRDAGMSEKVVFAMNFRKPPRVIQQKGGIEGKILSTLKEEGYTAPHQRKLYYYSAYLAARAAQGKLLLEGKMDDLTAWAILEDSAKCFTKLKSVDPKLTEKLLGTHHEEYISELKARYLHDKAVLTEAWQKTTLKALSAADADDCAELLRDKGLCPETVESIAEVSRWREMIGSLREHVMNKRTAGVLRDLGTMPVLNALRDIEGALSMREKTIQGDVENAKKEYEAAEELLQTFSSEAEEILEDKFLTSTDKAFADDYYDEVVIKAARLAANNAAPDIFEATGFWAQVGNLFTSIFGGDTLETKCLRIINKAYEDALYALGNAWSLELENNEIYRTQIHRTVRRTNKELEALWDRLHLDKDEMLQNISPVTVDLSGSIVVDANRMDVPEIVTALSRNYLIDDAKTSIDAGLTTFIAGNWVYAYLLPASFIIPGFGTIMAMIGAAVGGFVLWLRGQSRQKRINDMAEKIKDELIKSLTKGKDGIIRTIIEGQPEQPGVKFIRSFYLDAFKAMLDNQKKALEAKYNLKLAILGQSTEHREAIAKKARKWRTEKIAPMREAISKILARIEGIWGTAEA